MKRQLLIFAVTTTFTTVSGQNMQLLFYNASNGVQYKPGMMVHLGKGSDVDQGFKHIDSNYQGANGKANLPSNYTGQFIEIRKIKQSGTRKEGYKVYLICKSGPKSYWIEIEAAIKAGEVMAN